jgi:hypothetical protein
MSINKLFLNKDLFLSRSFPLSPAFFRLRSLFGETPAANHRLQGQSAKIQLLSDTYATTA